MIRIRESTPDDGERAVQIWRDAVDATHDFLTTEDRAAIEVEVRGFLPMAPLWLAVDIDDRPVGFMLLDGTSRMRKRSAFTNGWGSLPPVGPNWMARAATIR